VSFRYFAIAYADHSKLQIMANITYFVALPFFRLEDGELAAGEPMESPSDWAALATARALASQLDNAGAVAFSRTGDPKIGAFADAEVLGRFGETLDELTL
jgi:hypothetical protein